VMVVDLPLPLLPLSRPPLASPDAHPHLLLPLLSVRRNPYHGWYQLEERTHGATY
jgi:hypothetical protein